MMSTALVAGRGRSVLQQTRSHYNAHPFDNFTDEVLARLQNDSLLGRALAQHSRPGAVQVDVGCGTGKTFALLERCGRGKLIGIDLSISSLRKVGTRSPGAPLINASALSIPLPDGSASLVVSEGVLMITPDVKSAFRECARLVASGGHLFVSVYSANHRYQRVYRGFGSMLRRIVGLPGGEFLLRYLILPLWYVYFCYARSLLTRGTVSQLSRARSVNLFYDRYLVPHCTFHTAAELCEWGRRCGLEVVAASERGAMVEILLRRPAKSQSDYHSYDATSPAMAEAAAA